jgi:hypothetical protein
MPHEPFPNRTDANCRWTSDASDEYNCIGWAAHTTRHYIWPDEDEQFAWPIAQDRADTVDAIRTFFESLGFQPCPDDRLEAGFEKIAIYADANGPQHVARQLISGRWTSKLGRMADVEHVTLEVLADGHYGRVVLLMKRRYDGTPPRLPDLYPPPARLIRPGGDVLLR